MSKILAGFKFKPTHKDIHFLYIDAQSGKGSFSTAIAGATKFDSESQATRAIYAELSGFSQDDDYEWTPVLTDEKGSEIGSIRPFFKVGTPQFKEQDLPHFLNIGI